MKKILLSLLVTLVLPLTSHAACSEETLLQKETILLRFRLNILQYQKKEDDFANKVQAALNGKAYPDYRAEVMNGAENDESKKEALCSLVDQFIVMADDMLAGGDGSGTKKPWNRYTPEDVFAEKQVFDRLCHGEYKDDCSSDPIDLTAMEFIPVEDAMKSGKITPGEYIDQGYALYQRLLNILKGKNAP